VEDREDLLAEIMPVLKARSTEDWEDMFDTAGIPHSPIRSVGDALQSTQTRARLQVIDHGHGLRTVGQPVPFAGQPVEPPPSLGAQTDTVLQQYLGFGESDVEALRQRGAIG
jgi:formyl-CoA transferase